jgi:hypothetical protein
MPPRAARGRWPQRSSAALGHDRPTPKLAPTCYLGSGGVRAIHGNDAAPSGPVCTYFLAERYTAVDDDEIRAAMMAAVAE